MAADNLLITACQQECRWVWVHLYGYMHLLVGTCVSESLDFRDRVLTGQWPQVTIIANSITQQGMLKHHVKYGRSNTNLQMLWRQSAIAYTQTFWIHTGLLHLVCICLNCVMFVSGKGGERGVMHGFRCWFCCEEKTCSAVKRRPDLRIPRSYKLRSFA